MEAKTRKKIADAGRFNTSVNFPCHTEDTEALEKFRKANGDRSTSGAVRTIVRERLKAEGYLK